MVGGSFLGAKLSLAVDGFLVSMMGAFGSEAVGIETALSSEHMTGVAQR